MNRILRAAHIAIVYVLVFGGFPEHTLTALAQTSMEAAAQREAATAIPADLAAIVKQQFGPCFSIATTRTQISVNYLHPPQEWQTSWVPFFVGDLDGDGVEDAVIVARCKDPLADEIDFHYKVVDPYFTAHGYGNPKITSQFGSADPRGGNLLLVIHGSGKENWRAATPKAKFVFINLPFVSVSFAHTSYRKRILPAIKLEESESMSSVVYWNGKKYKWADVSGVN